MSCCRHQTEVPEAGSLAFVATVPALQSLCSVTGSHRLGIHSCSFQEIWSLGGWQGSAGSRYSLLLHGPQASPIALHCQDPNLHLRALWLAQPGLCWGQPHRLLSTSRTGGRGGDAPSLGVARIPVYLGGLYSAPAPQAVHPGLGLHLHRRCASLALGSRAQAQ